MRQLEFRINSHKVNDIEERERAYSWHFYTEKKDLRQQRVNDPLHFMLGFCPERHFWFDWVFWFFGSVENGNIERQLDAFAIWQKCKAKSHNKRDRKKKMKTKQNKWILICSSIIHFSIREKFNVVCVRHFCLALWPTPVTVTVTLCVSIISVHFALVVFVTIEVKFKRITWTNFENLIRFNEDWKSRQTETSRN